MIFIKRILTAHEIITVSIYRTAVVVTISDALLSMILTNRQ